MIWLYQIYDNIMTMLKDQRQQHIAQLIQGSSNVEIIDMANQFGTSVITIRRDLQELCQRGIIKRNRPEFQYFSSLDDIPIYKRNFVEREAKSRIATVAAKLIGKSQSIFLSGGSTIFYLARQLVDRRDLTIVTNALNIGLELSKGPELTVVVIGGVLRKSELSLIGHIADNSLKEILVDKVFLGMAGISLENGLTNDYLPEIGTDRVILNLNSEVIILADHTKIGKTLSAFVAPLERISTLITDEKADKDIIAGIKDRGVNVIIAETFLSTQAAL